MSVGTFHLISKSQTTYNTVVLEIESEVSLPMMPISSFIRIYNLEGDSRPYTPIKQVRNRLTILVKVYDNGRVSGYCNRLCLGDPLKVEYFFPKRTFKEDEFSNILMISGGTGITPMLQILNNHHKSAFYHLINLNRTPNDIIECDQLLKLEGPTLRITNIFSRPFKNETDYFTDINSEFDLNDASNLPTKPITKSPFKNNFYRKLDLDLLRTIIGVDRYDFVYVCGPLEMMKSVCGTKTLDKQQGKLTGFLKEIWFTEDNVYKF